MQEVVFREERSAVVSASGRDADRLGLAVMRVSGDERQEGYPEAGGKGRASPAYDSLRTFLHLFCGCP